MRLLISSVSIRSVPSRTPPISRYDDVEPRGPHESHAGVAREPHGSHAGATREARGSHAAAIREPRGQEPCGNHPRTAWGPHPHAALSARRGVVPPYLDIRLFPVVNVFPVVNQLSTSCQPVVNPDVNHKIRVNYNTLGHPLPNSFF